jgi:hypothetical protein
MVSKLSSNEVVTPAAYVLYYKRRNIFNNLNEINYKAIRIYPDDVPQPIE